MVVWKELLWDIDPVANIKQKQYCVETNIKQKINIFWFMCIYAPILRVFVWVLQYLILPNKQNMLNRVCKLNDIKSHIKGINKRTETQINVSLFQTRLWSGWLLKSGMFQCI